MEVMLFGKHPNPQEEEVIYSDDAHHLEDYDDDVDDESSVVIEDIEEWREKAESEGWVTWHNTSR
jgi:hypothetical protein